MFYKSSLESDKIHIATYGKAKAILQLMEHFGAVSPFQEIYLFDQVQDLKRLLPYLPHNFIYRQDAPLGNKLLTNLKKCGTKQDMIPYFEKLKLQSDDHVLLVLPTQMPNLPRYESGGAFNVVINKGHNAMIEFVGRGFDARELTNGVALHELYILDWDDILFCDSGQELNRHKSKNLTADEYRKNRIDRMNYLSQSHFEPQAFEPFLPPDYHAIPNGVKTKILNDILFPLFTKMQFHVLPESQYWVCGNITTDNHIFPFEFSSMERLLSAPPCESVQEK